MGFWFAMLVNLAVNLVVGLLLAKPPTSNFKAKGLNDFNFPTASADRDLQINVGDVFITAANVIWYGDFEKKIITEKVRSGFKKKKVPVGAEYFVGMELALGLGLDELNEVWFGDRMVWSGSVTHGQTFTIDDREAFGGRKNGGGVYAVCRFYAGTASQTADTYMTNQVGAAYAHRGLAKVVFYGPSYSPGSGLLTETGNVPAIKYRGKRLFAHLGSGYEDINGDANPAETIYALMTGKYMPFAGDPVVPHLTTDKIDQASFVAAAQQLHTENMGIQFQWQSNTPPADVISDILKHIDADIVQDPITGQYGLSLMRDDFDPNTIPSFTDDDIIEVKSYGRNAINDTINEFSATYTNKDKQHAKEPLSVPDLGNMFANRSHGSASADFTMFTDASVVEGRMMQELAQQSTSLARGELILKRVARDLKPGQPFKWSHSKRGITDLVCRAGPIDGGSHKNRSISVKYVEDVFSLGVAIYSAPPPSDWVDYHQSPAAVVEQLLEEMPYTLLEGEPAHRLIMLARSENSAFEFDAQYQVNGGGFVEAETGSQFMATGLVDTAYPIATNAIDNVTGMVIDFVPPIGAVTDKQVREDFYNWFLTEQGEWMACLSATDNLDGTWTLNNVYRGLLDTVPMAHPAGTRVWFLDSVEDLGASFVNGDNVQAKFLPRTTLGMLDDTLASVVAKTINRRADRPFPPGNLRLNGARYPTSISGELTVAWSHRDRTDLTVYDDEDPSVGPEAGTTYTLEIYGDGGGLKHTEPGLTGQSYTYPTATEESENGGGVNSSLRVKLWAVNSGLDSHLVHDYSFTRV